MGLSDFERELAQSKASRDPRKKRRRSRSRDRKPERERHNTSSHRKRDRSRSPKRSRHADKQRQYSSDEDDAKSVKKRSKRHLMSESEESEDILPDPGNVPPLDEDTLDDLLEQAADKDLERDSWMKEPNALDVEYVSSKRKRKDEKSKYVKATAAKASGMEEYDASVYEHEVRAQLEAAALDERAAKDVNYTFGDSGSAWRMMQLNNVFRESKQTGKSIEDVALRIYGDLRDFDAAREEEVEVDRKKRYGKNYDGIQKPTGELYKERLEKEKEKAESRYDPTAIDLPQSEELAVAADSPAQVAEHGQSQLNKLKARLMKARLKKDPNLASIEAEYNAALGNSSKPGNKTITLSVMENRMLAGRASEVVAVTDKRGHATGQLRENQDMTIEDMLRQERRSKGRSEGFLLADRITKDAKFTDDLEYLDDNAERLAKRAVKSDITLKSVAVGDYQNMQRILDSCPLCYHESDQDEQTDPVAPVVSRATRTYLTLPTIPEITPDGLGAVIAPIEHHDNLLHCDDDEWEEIRNFMKCLTQMYHSQGRDVIFYENAARPHKHQHAALHAVPVPHSVGATASAFFRESILTADEEWSQHNKIIDTLAKAQGGMGRNAFRNSLAKEMPYFHAWFTIDGGMGHIIEDEGRWPKADLFAREVLGGMMGVDQHRIRKQGRWHRRDKRDEKRLRDFSKRWKKYDWSRALVETEQSLQQG